jgi:hypothetical protein
MSLRTIIDAMNPITRRTFLEASAVAGASLTMAPAFAQEAAPKLEASSEKPNKKWYESAYRRAVIDMHIPDWDEQFFSQFSAQDYAEQLVNSRAQSIVCYCQSHVGLFNYPTKIGRQHQGWKGKNALAEMIEACHAKGIAVALYVSLIFDRDAGDRHPEWRMRTWDGKLQGEGGRHGVLCVNSPYREYVRSFVREICETFDFEGLRFDMTFWPWLCFCDFCQTRFKEEAPQFAAGGLPTTVDWLDEKWVAFQRARERWLTEFAAIATSEVRQHKPKASVEHQSSTYPLNWMFGVAAPLAEQNDFLQGDFYGDQLQGSFVRKLLEELTPHRPFGYETSFSVALKDHTAMKPEALLEAKAAAAIADSAAFIFIDAIDPVGTVNPRAHARMGKIFDSLEGYYQHLGGERVREIGLYYSLESKFNMAGNGKHVSAPDTSDSHTEASMQAAARLIAGHFPFGVLTKKSLSKLGDLKVLVLANVNAMDDEECAAIREYVAGGGKLLASGCTSLVDKAGRQRADFALTDVFGVSLEEAIWSPRNHYLSPTPSGQPLFREFDERYPAFSSGYYFGVRAGEKAKTLATITLPWPAPDATQFASIHSDPPWTPTDKPAIVRSAFGKGEAIYCASPIETLETLRDVYLQLVSQLHSTYVYSVDAPSCVEATVFHQPDRQRYVISLVNFQKDLPNLPVYGVEVQLRLPHAVKSVVQLPDEREIPTRVRDGATIFNAPKLETLAMFAAKLS